MKRVQKRIPVKKVQRSQRKRLSEEDTIQILKMFHKDGYGQSEIAAKFKVTRQRIYKILKTTDISVVNGTMIFDPQSVLSRKDLDPFTRAKMLSDDAIQVCELTMGLIRHDLENTIKAMADNKDFANMALTANKLEKLTKFISVAAPYAMDKKVSSGLKGKVEDTAKGNLGKMIKLKQA